MKTDLTIIQIIKLPSQTLINKSGIIAYVKSSPNTDEYYFACGNNWVNITRCLIFKLSYENLINECWCLHGK